jgi:hypothetical protein
MKRFTNTHAAILAFTFLGCALGTSFQKIFGNSKMGFNYRDYKSDVSIFRKGNLFLCHPRRLINISKERKFFSRDVMLIVTNDQIDFLFSESMKKDFEYYVAYLKRVYGVELKINENMAQEELFFLISVWIYSRIFSEKQKKNPMNYEKMVEVLKNDLETKFSKLFKMYDFKKVINDISVSITADYIEEVYPHIDNVIFDAYVVADTDIPFLVANLLTSVVNEPFNVFCSHSISFRQNNSDKPEEWKTF